MVTAAVISCHALQTNSRKEIDQEAPVKNNSDVIQLEPGLRGIRAGCGNLAAEFGVSEGRYTNWSRTEGTDQNFFL